MEPSAAMGSLTRMDRHVGYLAKQYLQGLPLAPWLSNGLQVPKSCRGKILALASLWYR